MTDTTLPKRVAQTLAICGSFDVHWSAEYIAEASAAGRGDDLYTADQLSAFAERVRQDERERAEQDAKRYRWWSSRPNIRLNLFQGKYRIVDSEYLITDWHESADAAIDAAMAQQVPERAE
jgi:hypothetical protein